MGVLMLNDSIGFRRIPVAVVPFSDVPGRFLFKRRALLGSKRAEDAPVLGLMNTAIQDHANLCLTPELSGGCRVSMIVAQPTHSRPLERIVRHTPNRG